MADWGCVYVADYGNGDTFKIGCTMVEPEKRLGQINRGAVLMPKEYGMQLVMVGYVSDYRRLEGLLHDRFRDRQNNGEWFYLSFPELVEIYQVFYLLGDPKLYDRWYALVPEDVDPLIDAGLIRPGYPRFKSKREGHTNRV